MMLQTCAICGITAPNLDQHHPSFRYFHRNEKIYLCRKCHTYVHENVKWATENGFIIRKYQYGKENTESTQQVD